MQSSFLWGISMRICLYTESALPMMGGQELVVDALARQFIAFGHKAIVLAPQPRSPLRPNDDSLPYPVVRHPRFISTQRFLGWYGRYLGKLHRRYKFDLIHCHSVYPTGYIAARCNAIAKIPVAITSHCGDVDYSSRLLKKPRLPHRFSIALQRVAAAIAISRFVEKRFRELCLGVRRIERIPNGVDVNRFAHPVPRPTALNPAILDGRYLLFLGSFNHRKGVDLLLNAFAISEIPSDFQLVIAGEGPLEQELKQQAISLGLEDRVHFVGRVEGDIKTYLLQQAYCTVMPSRISEGFPLVILETFAAGRPLIGTRIPGIADAVSPDRTGILVMPDSPMDLGRAITAACHDPAQIEQLGRQARHVAEGYDWSAVAIEHLTLFEDLIGSPSSIPITSYIVGVRHQKPSGLPARAAA